MVWDHVEWLTMNNVSKHATFKMDSECDMNGLWQNNVILRDKVYKMATKRYPQNNYIFDKYQLHTSPDFIVW